MARQAPAPQHAANLAYQPTLSPAQLVSITREARPVAAAVRQPAAAVTAAARSYTVRPGDSLSAIAGNLYHNPAAWPVLYWGNRGEIRWADLIQIGQVLHVPAKPARIPAPPAQLAPPAPRIRTVAAHTPKHASPPPAQAPAPAPAPPPSAQIPASAGGGSGPWPGGAFGNCVVTRESGGNPNAWNPSGHWGLYQFSASTWAAYGGNPADWGHAGIAEQEQVFMNALSQGGQNNWAPYDGC